jgi:hypothetical protein
VLDGGSPIAAEPLFRRNQAARSPLPPLVIAVLGPEPVIGTLVVVGELDTAHVSVTRAPIDRIVDHVPMSRTEGDLTIVPVFEQVIVVETKLLLKEEIHIRRTLTKETVERSVTYTRSGSSSKTSAEGSNYRRIGKAQG